METIPKIVKERLKSAAVATDHPDPDVLTAFSERTLADAERGRVLEHLAHCTECREVVALALPSQEPSLAAVAPMRDRRFTWARLRWGLVAAGVIVVGSFGMLRYEQAHREGPIALQSAPTEKAVEEANNQTDSPLAFSAEARAPMPLNVPPTKSSKVAPKQIPETKKESDAVDLVGRSQTPPSDQATGRRTTTLRKQLLAHGPMPTTQWQQNSNANSANQLLTFDSQPPSTAPGEAAANQHAADVSAQAAQATIAPMGGPASSQKRVYDLDTLATRGQSVEPLPSTARNSGSEVARAKDAQPPSPSAPKAQVVGAYAVPETATSNFSPSGSLVPESARWTINSAGGLQRSFDQGHTWQTVDVNDSPRDSEGISLQRAMKSSSAKSKDKSDVKSAHIIFRAVAANGPDVWAGGSETTLFHSTDSGDHWLRVQPSWRGVQLSGDILSLQFADPQHGRIVTSTSEIWTTADGGQTWDKQ